MDISFPSDTRDFINKIRGAIGRDVMFYTAVTTECSVCSEDPVTHTSTNPYCTTCSGVHFIHTFSGVSISGHIFWNPSEGMQWTPGGQYFTGDCRVQIEYTPGNISILENTEYIVVDSKRLRIDKKIYRGVPQLNRVLLDCTEE